MFRLKKLLSSEERREPAQNTLTSSDSKKEVVDHDEFMQDIDTTLKKCLPIIHDSVYKGNTEEVEQLSLHKKLLELTDEEGNTPLHTIFLEGCNTDNRTTMVKLLLKAGLSPDVANNHGITFRDLLGVHATDELKEVIGEFDTNHNCL